MWDHYYPVFGGVGAGGRSQLVDLYGLINRITAELEPLGLHCSGLHVASEDFSAIHAGSQYPGRLLRWSRNDGWWEDLGDLAEDRVKGDEPKCVELRNAIHVARFGLERKKG